MPDPSINKRLNLVLSVERLDKSVVHVHSVPISREIYESHYTFITMVMSSMYSDDFSPATCSRIAYLRMRELGSKEENKARFGDIDKTLLAEIWRLTNVLVPGERGWETVPFYEVMERAQNQGPLDLDDVREVQNYICFFTAASWGHTSRGEREAMYDVLTRYGALITPSDVTVHRTSLSISSPEENIGEKLITSSHPV